jgi:hypothetical protein
MPIRFVALESALVDNLRGGGLDANGQRPEVAVSSGTGVPCRHCLEQVDRGERYLILAHRPFPEPQPYAEIGPIFLHADGCRRGGGAHTPPMLASAQYIIRGYCNRHRIVYGTGSIVPTSAIRDAAAELLANPAIAYVHVRSASNNCYQCRIERGS